MTTTTPNAPAWLDRAAYPFAPHFASLRAGRMHYVDEGHGSPVLFVHGTPTWSFEYRHLIRALSPYRRCIAPDHFGFGLSDRPGTFAYTPEAHADALNEFVTSLGLSDITLVVHDFGGPIGLPLRLKDSSRVSRVVIINSWMWAFDDDPSMSKKAKIAGGALGRLLYRFMNVSLKVIMPSAYGDRKALTPEIHRQYLEVFRDPSARVTVLHALATSLLGSSGFFASLESRAGRLQGIPVLLLWGMKDSAFPPYLLDRWISLVPHASVVRLATAGHWPHEEQPDAVSAAIGDWLGVR